MLLNFIFCSKWSCVLERVGWVLAIALIAMSG